MHNIIDIFKRRFDLCFGMLLLIMAITILCIRFIALPQNLIFSDEGWYLSLLRDLPHSGVTRFHLLFHNLFDNNIYAIRLSCLILQVLASAFMAFGLAIWVNKYYSNCKVWQIFLLLFSALFLVQGVEDCPSFNYINLNKICVEFSVGFLFMGLAKQKSWYYLMTGFLIAFLFPIMITNTILIPVVFVVILLLSKNKKNDALMFCIGVVLFVVYYIVFVESPQEIMSFLVSETKSTVGRGTSDYGARSLLTWVKNTLLYLTKYFVISLLLYGSYRSLIMKRAVNCNRTTAFVLFGIIAFMLLHYFWRYLPPDLPKAHLGDLMWTFLFFMLLVCYIGNKEVKQNEIILVLVMMIIPIALSFGSIVHFYYRGQSYFVFLVPMLLLLSLRKGMKWRMLLLSFFVFAFVLFLASLSRSNWHGEMLFDNQVSVKTIGIEQNVNLSDRYVKELKECDNRIPQGEILCDFENWGLVCLLDYTPVSYDYDVSRNDEIVFQSVVDKAMEGKEGLWAVVRQWNKPFLDKLNSLEGYKMRMDSVAGIDNYYIYITRTQLNVEGEEL